MHPMIKDSAKLGSPYKRGADNGIVMGIYMSVTCCVWSYAVFDTGATPMLGLLGMVLALGVPGLLFIMMRRSFVKDDGLTPLAALWMEGIMTFIFGGLIALVAGYVFMRFVQPDYLANLYELMHRSLLTAAKNSQGADAEQYRQIAANFQVMVERGEMPDALGLLVNMMWGIAFSGCIVSLLVALLTRAFKVKKSML